MTVTVLLWLEQNCIVSPPLSFGSLFKRKEKKSPDANRSGKFDKPPRRRVLLPLISKTDLTFKINYVHHRRIGPYREWTDEIVGDMSRNLMPVKQHWKIPSYHR